MAITGLPTSAGNDLVTVTPTGWYSVNGLDGTDTLRVDYRTLTTNIFYRYVSNNWYTFNDDFHSRIDHYSFERYELLFGAGDDQLQGGALNDNLSGGGGNDVITSGVGADTIDGGTGQDRWVGGYGDLNVDVSVSLLKTGWFTVAATGAQLRGIEAASLTTGAGADMLDARRVTGDQSFNSGAGNDVLRVTSGKSSFNAGLGTDRLEADFSASTSSVTQKYTSNNWYRIGDADGTRSVDYYSVERFYLWGGSANDTLSGAGDVDRLYGNGGNDWLNGGAGADLIDGGAGRDTWQADHGARTLGTTVNLNDQTSNVATLAGIEAMSFTSGKGNDVLIAHAGRYDDYVFGNDGNDVIATGQGRDTVNGGLGTDTMIMDWSAVTDPRADIVHRYVSNDWYRYSNKAGDRVDYYGIEKFNLTGGAGNDYLVGRADSDTLVGGAGNDTLDSAVGRATIDGGAGNDLWNADLSAYNFAILFDAGDSQTNSQMLARSFDLRNIERVGLTLGAGDDAISTAGYALDDWVNAGTGNDTLSMGLGKDNVNGGDGDDLLVIDYSGQSGAVSSRYTSNGWNRYSAGADAHFVDYYGIERFDVTGGSADDSLSGGGAHDILRGGAGNDLLNSGAGTAVIDGGTGNDQWSADLSAFNSNLVFDAAASQTKAQMTDRGFSIRNVESVAITLGAGNDKISTRGYALDDVVNGGDGADVIETGLGFDQVNAGNGIDTLVIDYSSLTSDITTVYTWNGWNRYSDNDGSASVDYYSVERFNLKGGTGHDALQGGAYGDTLSGGGGNDTLNGGSGGNDKISGGGGVDTWVMDLGASTVAHTLTLDASGNGTVSNNNTTVSSIENVHLTTGTGNDTINLGASRGNHVLSLGLGDDVVNLGKGLRHTLNAGGGTDRMIVDASAADGALRTVYVGNDWNSIQSTTGAYDLTYYGVESMELTGSAFADRLHGLTGSDVLRGGAGRDILNGFAGNDTLYGGAGADQFEFSSLTANGVDLVADAEAGDFLRFNGAQINSLTAGNGSGVVQWQAQVQASGGVTSIFIGLDGTAGYDFRVDLAGSFTAANFQIVNDANHGGAADLILL